MVGELLGWLLAVGLAGVAGYAQHRLPHHTASAAQAGLARGVLAACGIGLGWLGAAWQPGTGLEDVRTFVTGFGLVHVPAAFILWSKRARGVYR